MGKDVELVYQRNKWLLFGLAGYYLVSLVVNVAVLGISALFPPVGLILCSTLALLIYKKTYIKTTMYLLVLFIFLYFFYLITDYPFLVNYVFMWFGLILSSVYQKISVIIFAGVLSILLTFYAFFGFHEEIFPNVVYSDIVYLILFCIFITVYLVFSTRFTSRLREKTQRDEEKIKNLLANANIMTFSYDLNTGDTVINSNLKTMLPTEIAPKGLIQWKEYVHPLDLEKINQAEQEIQQGAEKVIEYRLLPREGQQTWLRCHFIPIFDNPKQKRIDGILTDITEEKLQEEHMENLAYQDPLTGLPNRSFLAKYFQKADAEEENLYLFFIDLDSFKEVNDTYGHHIGDQVLKIIAKRIQSWIRESDILSRIGGDEFVGILKGLSKEDVGKIIGRMQESLAEPISIDKQLITITASIGVSVYHPGDELDKLIINADKAMYMVKQSGKNDIRFIS